MYTQEIAKDVNVLAGEITAAGLTFEDWAQQYPRLAASQYGRDVEQAIADQWMEDHGDDLPVDHVEHDRYIAGGSDCLEIAEQEHYTGMNDRETGVGYKAYQNVLTLSHWEPRPVGQHFESDDETCRVQAYGNLAGQSADIDMGATMNLAKFEAHVKKQHKRRRIHGLEFMTNTQGNLLCSLRPSTRAKVRLGYAEQVLAENAEPKPEQHSNMALRDWKAGIKSVFPCPADTRPALSISESGSQTCYRFVGPIKMTKYDHIPEPVFKHTATVEDASESRYIAWLERTGCLNPRLAK